ncbi:hypothetical protein BH11BAC2_BH11BAC2_25760 [soil metagenome]
MKTTLLIVKLSALLTLLFLCIKLVPKDLFQTKESIVSLMVDITDSSLAKPDPVSVMEQFNLLQSKFNGATFRMTSLSDVSVNPISQLVLRPASILLSNEISRDKEVKDFTDSVSKSISDAESNAKGRSNSSIYFPIVKELTQLSEITANSKTLIVYSDLMENSSELSFYGINKSILLNEPVEKLTARFLEMSPLPDLSNMVVYFIYQPENPEEDAAYKKISQVYQAMLSQKGALVHIQANLIKN